MNQIKLVILIIILLSISSFGQFQQKSEFSGVGVPFFDVDVFRTFTEDGKNNKIMLYSEMLYDDITFVRKSDNSFNAQIEFAIQILDNNEEQVRSKNLIKELNESDYDLTNSREKRMILNEEFILPPGDYVIKVQANDLISNKTINRKVELNLKDISEKSIVLSDILLLEDIVTDSAGKLINIVPKVKNNFPEKLEYFYIYYELYSAKIPKNIQIRYQFLTKGDEVDFDSLIVVKAEKIVSGHYFKIEKKRFQKNNYIIVLKIEDADESSERRKLISFYWVTTPQTSEDITLALRQMRYIIPEDSLDKYLDANIEDQKKYFNSYWKQRDPNPNTAINELMEEYFGRVNKSNREFSTFENNGWLTDRGRLLIKFGYPDDVERHPFELQTNPYVIWRYYSLRKIFLFVDRTGFGDYQLHPDYFDQEWR
jgi:GWxTD domain-containing protein